MARKFPSIEWLQDLKVTLSNDERYRRIARNWEGDIVFVIESDSDQSSPPIYYWFDLWHGTCRDVRQINTEIETLPESTFTLQAKLNKYMKILNGELDPLQAMVTRQLQLRGNLGYMLRNVPTVLDFVRCCRLVGIEE
jgi:putative sterol carrier protein